MTLKSISLKYWVLRVVYIINPLNNDIIYDTQAGASDTAAPATSVTAGNVLAH